MKTVTNAWIMALIGCLAVFLVLFSIFAHRDLEQIRAARRDARRTYDLQRQVSELYSTLKDAETGQRGFIITGRDEYLEPYLLAVDRLAPLRSEVDLMLEPGSRQDARFDELQALIDAKLKEMQQSITLRRERGFEAAQENVMSDEGRVSMDQIRRIMEAMQMRESTRLDERAAIVEGQINSAVRGNVFTLLIGLVACGLVVGLVERALRIRQQATERVRQEQENLRVTLESIGDGVIATDARGDVTLLNPVAQKLTGWSLDEALGQPSTKVFQIVNEQTGEVVESPVSRVLREGAIVGLANHTLLIAKDGRRLPIADSGAPIRRGEEIVGAIMVFRDMTEQRHIELENERALRALETERSRLSSVIEAMPVGVILSDEHGRLKQFNEALTRIWGNPPMSGSIDEYRAWKGWWPQTGEEVKAGEWALARALKQGEVCRGEEVIIEGFDGVRRTILNSASPIYDSQGTLIGGVVAEFDITEQASTRASLADAQSRLESMLEIGDIGTWDWDIEHNRVFADRNLAQMFGVSAEDAQGGPLDVYVHAVHPDDRPSLKEAIESSLASGEHFTVDYRLVDPDGQIRWMTARARIERDADGRAQRMPGVIIDVTERRMLEDNLRSLATDLSIADQRKNDFIATLAHELRNPLAPIRTGMETLKWHGGKQESADESFRQVIETMERQIRQMVRLIDDLLDISRITRGSLSLRRQPCEISEIHNNAIESTSPHFEERSQEFFASLPEENVCVDADAARLTQVIANLLDNAAKYTPHGGKIWLKVFEADEKLTISVRDNGFGIAPEMQAHIFQMFGQIKRSLEEGYSGLGIGLTLVKTIVELHDGTIEVSSEGVNQGSEFRIILPTCDLPDEETFKPDQLGVVMPAGRSLKVLVVDDNRAAAKMLKLMIEKLGHRVELAHDGLEGIEQARAYRPHVILMDIGMPRMNGYEATRRINAEDWGSQIVIAALSGWGHEDDKRRTQEAGFDYHLVKPAELTALNEVLQAVASLPQNESDAERNEEGADHEEEGAEHLLMIETLEAVTPASSNGAATLLSAPEIVPDEVRRIAHDIKTPLSIITMGLELLKQQSNLNDEQKTLCEMMDADGVRELQKLIGALVEQLRQAGAVR